eukprot:TRINITY_DN4750_c0_g1_i4.p1 TRINITY_DN4750_c0_g1~~TRINITY_DN4750_c0_g1_i4.p1  ORF type:complete len:572 (-),score=35.73 TRINITY_DN4750_c0_g1_i4:258-1760(-)
MDGEEAQLYTIQSRRILDDQDTQQSSINNFQCYQLPIKSSLIDDLSNQQRLVYHNFPRLFGGWGSLSNSHEDSVYVCNLFTHDYENCKPPPRNREGIERGWHTPNGWDWRVYMRYYPETIQWSKGHINENVALQHFNEVGRYEGRIPRKMNMIVRYTTCGNIVEQQYSHMSAIALSTLLGAKLIMPPLFKKDSKQNWKQFSQNLVLNTSEIIEIWSRKGHEIEFNETLQQTIPDMDNPETAYLQDFYEGFLEEQYLQLDYLYRKLVPILDVLFRIKRDALMQYRTAFLFHKGKCLNGLVLDLPCSLFSLESSTLFPYFSEIAQSLKFNSRIHNLAEKVIQHLKNEQGQAYNAIHIDPLQIEYLKIEQDQYYDKYFQLMRQLGFSNSTGTYLVTGLAQGQGQAQVQVGYFSSTVVGLELTGSVLTKEMILGQEVVKKLESEESEAIDLLVLLESELFVGLRQSLFSFYIAEYRKLQGRKSDLIDLPQLGNTTLFQKGAVLS